MKLVIKKCVICENETNIDLKRDYRYCPKCGLLYIL